MQQYAVLRQGLRGREQQHSCVGSAGRILHVDKLLPQIHMNHSDVPLLESFDRYRCSPPRGVDTQQSSRPQADG